MDQSKMKVVYVISNRGERRYWNRVGVAFVNNDGSINCKLDSLPVSGELQIRDYSPKEQASTERFTRGSGAEVIAL